MFAYYAKVQGEKSAAEGGLRERKKRATRAALVDAAVRLAAEHGAESVTVEAISEAAGVSPRTFFNYFASRDDVFVMVGAESSAGVRRAVLEAPSELSPLEALRTAMAGELAEIAEQNDLWSLHAEVLRGSPHLLVRSLGVHMADEAELADVLAERIGARPSAGSAGAVGSVGSAGSAGSAEGPGLYPRLLAAVGSTAVRVAVEYWCARQDELAFTDVFHEVFEHLAAGLPRPPERS
ncbi:TetR family transcriptional regulator [Actinomadura sp. CNU-125]|uniref:TetR family transcriptional regulator n=1 Tax=Actinomadura sp. CNU-125 TaxID=1904961 RepID=UPI00095FEB93|nr:TetR family transcriptional regulator [Actinomadura sp. CNU-125]OLT12137.1 TetR family transcriptional regulator [Actinomadura sp. CNU-125]